MYIDVNKVPDRVKEANDYLNYADEDLPYDENNHVYINYDKVHAIYEKLVGAMANLENDISELQYEHIGKWEGFNPNAPTDMRRTLFNRFKFPEDKFKHQGKTSFKLEVLERFNSSYPHPILEAIIAWKKLANLKQGLIWYYERLIPIDGITNNAGDRIAKLRANYTKIETLRLETYAPNLQGLNLDFADIITAKKGWVVVQVDSGQIEPRLWYSTRVKDPLLNWLIEQYDDVYYAITDYCLRESTDFNESNLFLTENLDKSQRDAIKTIVNAGSYGSSNEAIRFKFRKVVESMMSQSDGGRFIIQEINNIKMYEGQLASDKVKDKYKPAMREKWTNALKYLEDLTTYSKFLSDRYISRIINHPQRKKLDEEIKKKLNNRDKTVVSLFGDERVVYGDYNYKRNCFLNNPMQMAVSRLSAISICKAFELIKGLPNGQDYIRYAFQKHDECIFYVREDKYEELLPILSDLRSYEFDEWINIKGEAKVGFDYKK